VPRFAHLDAKPPQAALAQRHRLRKCEQPAAVICAQVVQVRMHGVCPSAEVDVVREVQRSLLAVLLRDAQLVHEVAPQRVQLAILLANLFSKRGRWVSVRLTQHRNQLGSPCLSCGAAVLAQVSPLPQVETHSAAAAKPTITCQRVRAHRRLAAVAQQLQASLVQRELRRRQLRQRHVLGQGGARVVSNRA
jgi:hypothetical protein